MKSRRKVKGGRYIKKNIDDIDDRAFATQDELQEEERIRIEELGERLRQQYILIQARIEDIQNIINMSQDAVNYLGDVVNDLMRDVNIFYGRKKRKRDDDNSMSSTELNESLTAIDSFNQVIRQYNRKLIKNQRLLNSLLNERNKIGRMLGL